MAVLWHDPEINHWWLPNEEAYPSVVRSVRSVMEDRLRGTSNLQRSKEQRDMRGIFAAMSIEDVDKAEARDCRNNNKALGQAEPLTCPSLPTETNLERDKIAQSRRN